MLSPDLFSNQERQPMMSSVQKSSRSDSSAEDGRRTSRGRRDRDKTYSGGRKRSANGRPPSKGGKGQGRAKHRST